MRLELGITYGESSFEEVADALPYLFDKQPREPKDFNLSDYLAKVAKYLDKNGIANADDIVALVHMMANKPELVKAAVHAVYSKSAGAIESNVA